MTYSTTSTENTIQPLVPVPARVPTVELEIALSVPAGIGSVCTFKDVKLFLEKAALLGFTDDDEIYEASLSVMKIFNAEDLLPVSNEELVEDSPGNWRLADVPRANRQLFIG